MEGPPFSVQCDEVRGLFGGRFDIESVARVDVLAENEQLRQRGLSTLAEQVYVLRPKGI
jgi:thiopurine S-methyltransferase